MKTVGIVAEYNPIHSGHIYQLKSLKENGFTHIVVAMSGNFVQRGEPALFNKFTRAELAIKSGADLVIEIPTPYAMSTAEKFALGSIHLLKNCGVEYLSFGSECGDITKLKECCDAINNNEVNIKTKQFLSEGLTYVVARQKAIEILYGKDISTIIEKPNNTLGIEYINAINKLNTTIEPITIRRKGANHDDFSDDFKDCEHISASKIREIILNKNIDSLKNYLSANVYETLISEINKGNIYLPKSFDRVLLSKLRTMNINDIKELPDISEGLENRIFKAIKDSNSYKELLINTKTKRYTLARLRRIYMYALLNLTKDFYDELPPYVRILAMNDNGKEILRKMKTNSMLPVMSSLKDLSKINDHTKKFAEFEFNSTNMYSTLTQNITPYGTDYLQKLKIIE